MRDCYTTFLSRHPSHLAPDVAIRVAKLRAKERAWRNSRPPIHERFQASRPGASARVPSAKPRKD
jgi:hypothetical protein